MHRMYQYVLGEEIILMEYLLEDPAKSFTWDGVREYALNSTLGEGNQAIVDGVLAPRRAAGTIVLLVV